MDSCLRVGEGRDPAAIDFEVQGKLETGAENRDNKVGKRDTGSRVKTVWLWTAGVWIVLAVLLLESRVWLCVHHHLTQICPTRVRKRCGWWTDTLPARKPAMKLSVRLLLKARSGCLFTTPIFLFVEPVITAHWLRLSSLCRGTASIDSWKWVTLTRMPAAESMVWMWWGFWHPCF